MRSRVLRRLTALTVAGVTFSVITAAVFVFPSKGSNKHAAAVVVLDDGTGVRRAKAIEAVQTGVATNLVVSHHADRPQDCPVVPNVSVLCFSPPNDNTKGEAEEIAKLAQEHGWASLIFVTDPPHVARARFRISRCFSGRIGAITTDVTNEDWPIRIIYEWVATTKAVVADRSC